MVTLYNIRVNVIVCVVLFLLISSIVQAQPIGGAPGVETRRAAINFLSVAASATPEIGIHTRLKKIPPEVEPPRYLPVPEGVGLPTDMPEGLHIKIPAEIMSSPSPPPADDFAALSDNNTAIPPDVHGAAGPSHLMVTLNSQVRIQDKTGGVISTMSLDLFWSSLGSPNAFDPRILYDPYANHWIFVSAANPQLASSAILIGVSATSDPTGSWNLFSVDADPTNTKWADYPCVGFNKDWITVQINMFTMAGAFSNSKVYIFKKSDLYTDVAATHTLVSLDMSLGGTQVPALTYDNSLSTLYLVQNWNGNSGGNGFLRLYTITGSIGSEVVTPSSFVTTANPWQEDATGGPDFAPQLGSVQKIAANDSRIQNVVYRNGSLWTTQTVFLPASGTTTRSSVQWWELTTGGVITQRSRVDDPTNTNFYAFPSIGVNSNDEVVIGYSKFSATTYASGWYSYRSASDAVNTLRDEVELKAGENPYYKTFTGDENRWGDYTNTVVDPSNDIDLWTIQEYAATPANRWGTWWGKIATPVVQF
ncbi:MAG: hypothetical protein EPO24_06655, partial [Bacteroidetes bacterium]